MFQEVVKTLDLVKHLKIKTLISYFLAVSLLVSAVKANIEGDLVVAKGLLGVEPTI